MEFMGGLALSYLPLKRFYKYILKRLVGGFLRDDLDLEQLEVQLYRGIVQLTSLELDVAQFNFALAGAGLFLQFVTGFVGCIKMDVPWRHILKDHCKMYVSGLHLLLAFGGTKAGGVGCPRKRVTSGGAGAQGCAAGDAGSCLRNSPLASHVPERCGRYGYSDDGIETLSRLVKHVLARVEICFQDAEVSVLAPAADSMVSARLASAVVFSEQLSGTAEERSVRLMGFSFILAPNIGALTAFSRSAAEAPYAHIGAAFAKEALEREDVLVATTDAPNSGAPPGVLTVRRRDLHAPETELGMASGLGASRSGALTPAGTGVHLDIELFLHAVRVALTPSSWHSLANYVHALEGAPPLAATDVHIGAGQCLVPAEANTPARDASMVQSLVESTLAGNRSHAGFWYDMYNLFEADSHPENSARQEEMTQDHAAVWSDGSSDGAYVAEDIHALGASTIPQCQGPVMGYAIRLNVMHIGVMFAFSDGAPNSMPKPGDVCLHPGPSQDVNCCQVQFCGDKCELVVTQQTRGHGDHEFPTLTVKTLLRAAKVHLHRHVGKSSGALAQAKRPRVDPARQDTVPNHACVATHSGSGLGAKSPLALSRTPPVNVSDTALFSSARSALDSGSRAEAARSLKRNISDESCLTTESVDGAVPFFGSDESQMESEFESEPPCNAEVDVCEDAGRNAPNAPVVSTETNLEAAFFDRSRPILDVFLGHKLLSTSIVPQGFVDTDHVGKVDAVGWRETAPQFRSKQIFHLVPLACPEESTEVEKLWGGGHAGLSQEPRLTLPPAEHPLWAEMRLLNGGQCAGNQFRAEWVGSSSLSRNMLPFLTVETQPLVLELCAESVNMLAVGVALLSVPPTTSLPTKSRKDVAPFPVARQRDQGNEIALERVFRFVGVTPLLRLELLLGGADDRCCSLVADFVAPHVFCSPSGSWPQAHVNDACKCEYDESLRINLGDASIYLVAGMGSDVRHKHGVLAGGKASDASFEGSGTQFRCTRILSLGCGEDVGACANVKGTLAVFQRRDAAPQSVDQQAHGKQKLRDESGAAVGVMAPPAAFTASTASAPPSEAVAGATSEWTKISVPHQAEEGRPSKSSLILKDLRHASQRFLRPGQGGSGRENRSRRNGSSLPPSAIRAPTGEQSAGTTHQVRSVSMDAARCAEPRESTNSVTTEGQVEVELSVPQVVKLRFDAYSLWALEEGYYTFSNRLADLALNSPQRAAFVQEGVSIGVRRGFQKSACAAFTMVLECLELEVVEDEVVGEAGATSLENLVFQLTSLRCRGVQFSRLTMKICGLCQDMRLLGMRACQPTPEQFIRPWFQPLFSDPRPAHGAVKSVLSAEYPWEVRQPEHRTTMVLPAFFDTDRGRWRDTHSVFIQIDQRRLGGADHTNVSTKFGRLLFNAHPHMRQVIGRLGYFFSPPGFLARAPPRAVRAPGAFTVYHVAVLDGLVDLPSEAYAQSWPITSPNGLHVPTLQPSARGLDSDKWRVVVHVDGVELSFGALQGFASQGLKASCGGCNVFLVDHPSHLAHLDLISTSRHPITYLLNLGFAHVSAASSASAVWRSHCPGVGAGPASAANVEALAVSARTQELSGRSWHSIEVALGSITGNLCADSVKCLLCVGMELVDLLPQQRGGLDGRARADAGEQPEEMQEGSPFSSRRRDALAHEGSPQKLDGPDDQDSVPAEAVPTGETADMDVNILENIDVLAFEGSPTPREDARARSKAAARTTAEQSLRSCMIEDYLRNEEQMQSPRNPVQATCPSEGVQTAECDLTEVDPGACAFANREARSEHSTSAAPCGPVAVCLLDPEAYPQERLRELCVEDQAARLEVLRAHDTGEGETVVGASVVASEVERSGPLKPHNKRHVSHQDGSATLWLVDPEELQVVHDHFVRWVEPRDDRKLSPPAHSPPVELVVTLHCDSATLSLYGGTDFPDDAQNWLRNVPARGGEALPATGRLGRRRLAPHLSLKLQDTAIKLMHFNTFVHGRKVASTSSAPIHHRVAPSGGILKRRFVLCLKDFKIVDHVPGSVFSNLLSYFEDERRRPRPSHADMLYFGLEEVVPLPFQAGVAWPGSAVFGNASSAATSQAISRGDPEYRLDLKLLPLRLTIDQDVVDFAMDFMQLCTLPMYIEEESQEPTSAPQETTAGSPGVPFPRAPVDEASQANAIASSSIPKAILFQRVSVGALLLSVDYRAKRLDVDALKRGDLWELINLLPLLEGLEAAFRCVNVTNAMGLNQVTAQVVGAWSADLNRTQILRSLTGVTPIRSFANIGGGFAEMVLQPLKQYRAGGNTQRVSRAILRGLVSFLRHVTVESIDLTERVFVSTQSALEYATACLYEQQAHAALPAGGAMPSASSIPAALSIGAEGPAADFIEGNDGSLAWTPVQRGAADFLQPGCASEGLEQACTSLTRGMRHAGEAVIVRPMLEFQRGAPKEKVLRTVATGIPMCVLRPAIGATAAATTALRGVRNQVDPSHQREIVRKYKSPE